MKILVTGGAGFIASHVVDTYADAGHTVEVLDNMSTGREANKRADVVYHKMDIRDAEVDDLLKSGKYDVVNHHAAQIDVRKSANDPIYDADINILGTLNLINNCVKHDVKQFIMASTGGAIYGEQDYFPADEKHPIRPVSPYGVSKYSIERYLYYFHVEFGLDYHVLRYANVYGPRQNPHGEAGVVAIFMQKMLKGENAVINGKGNQSRDYVYVGDIANLNFLVLGKKGPMTLNAGKGTEDDVNQLFKYIKESTGSDQEEIHNEGVRGEQLRSSIDASLAKETYGWEAKVDLSTGIARTAEYFKKFVELDGNVR